MGCISEGIKSSLRCLQLGRGCKNYWLQRIADRQKKKGIWITKKTTKNKELDK